MRRCLPWFASIAFVLAGAAALSAEDSHVSLVPWKVLEPGAEPETAPLTLYWVPSSKDEMRRSDLLTSDELTAFASQCVAMRIVRLDDRETLRRIAVDKVLPVAVLVDAEGNLLGRAAADDLAEVEQVVREELEHRAEEAEMQLDEAGAKVGEGDLAGAIEIYREVWEQRCVCPRQARAAQRALKRLEK